MTTTVLNTKFCEIENKMPNASNLVTKNFLNTKISKDENKILDNSKYITAQEFNKFTAENCPARLKQVDLEVKKKLQSIL